MTPKLTELTPGEFREWLGFRVNLALFASHERLVGLLAENANRDALETEFREFFCEYEGLAFWLEEHEACVLAGLAASNELAHLKHRVAAIEAARKTSPKGRELRRMGSHLIGDPLPEIKVTALSDAEFRELMQTLVNSPLFAVQKRLVKLLKEVQHGNENLSLPEAAGSARLLQKKNALLVATDTRLKTDFWEFFVCYLELEQFLEDYDYDPDEGLEMRPEFVEEFDQQIAAFEAGEADMISLEDAFKECEEKSSCTP